MTWIKSAALLLGLTCGVALGARPLGSQECTWGPSYWCSGLQQAKGCGSVKHCIDNVWSNNPYPADDDDVCTICKNMVAEVRDQLESNETTELLKEVFYGSCKLIPIKMVAAECMKFSDEFIPELVETLASEMNPNTVCSVAGLCNSKRIDKLLAGFYRQHPPTYCEMCQTESRKLMFKVRDMDFDSLVDKSLEICNFVPQQVDACKSTVLDNFGLIYKYLMRFEDDVCDILNVCSGDIYPEANQFGNQIVPFKGDDVPCQFCTKVIQHWVDVWTSNVTEQEFKEVLEVFCNKLHDDQKEEECRHIIEDYYFPFYNFVLHQVHPRELCGLAGLCPNTARFTNSITETSAISKKTKKRVQVPEEPPVANDRVMVGGYFSPQSVQLLNQPGCTICEFMITKLETALKNNNTKAAVEKALDEVCGVIPESVRDQCNNLVNTYGRAVVELLAGGIPPKQVCTMLQLCGQNELQVIQMSPVIGKAQLEADNCATCEFTLGVVFDFLNNRDNRDEIRNVLESICYRLPSTVSDRCEAFIHEKIENLIELIVENLSAEEICRAMSMCQKKKQPIQQGEACILCEYIAQTLETMLQNKTDKDAVKNALDKLCIHLPKSVSQQCITFVDTYADMIIDFIVQGVTPEQLCTEIKLCDPQSSYDLSEALILANTRRLSDDLQGSSPDVATCRACDHFTSIVLTLYSQSKSELEIKTTLFKMCTEISNLGDLFIPLCKQTVKKLLPQAMSMARSGIQMDSLCSTSLYCPGRPEESNLASFTNAPTCVLCEFVMSVLEKQILTNSTLDQLERSVLMVCSLMPEAIAERCEDFVAKYGDMIIQAIVDAEMNPEGVCSSLSLCLSASFQGAIGVGGQSCPWGPSYWCSSMFHAISCGTTKYCQNLGKTFGDGLVIN